MVTLGIGDLVLPILLVLLGLGLILRGPR
jgi:hypothetical protein